MVAFLFFPIFLLVGSIVAGMSSFSFLEVIDVAQNYYSITIPVDGYWIF